jgi:hypothetical protein
VRPDPTLRPTANHSIIASGLGPELVFLRATGTGTHQNRKVRLIEVRVWTYIYTET